MIAELTVDLGALRRNVGRLAALAAPAGYAAVIKGNAYGHGLVPVARALESSVAAFCVYRTDEAQALRDAGVRAPVLILGPVEPRELETAVRCDAALALWSDGAFLRDAARAARAHETALRVHAKIDTGVTRLGLDPAGAAGIIEKRSARRMASTK